MFSGEWPIKRSIIKAVRQRFPEEIVCGWEHITALTEYSLRDCPESSVRARRKRASDV